jgi:hypothetical protein
MTLCRRSTTVLLFAALACGAASTAFAQPTDAAEQKELYNYVLTPQNVQKVMKVVRDLDAFQKSHPQIAKSDTESDGSIAGTQKSIEKYPQAVAIIAKDGLTPHEYVVASMTVIQGTLTVGFKKNGTYKEYPAEILKMISPANLKYIEAHYDEISRQMDAVNGGGAEIEHDLE